METDESLRFVCSARKENTKEIIFNFQTHVGGRVGLQIGEQFTQNARNGEKQFLGAAAAKQQ